VRFRRAALLDKEVTPEEADTIEMLETEKHIGPAHARRMVAYFGAGAWRMFKETPHLMGCAVGYKRIENIIKKRRKDGID